MSRVLAMRMVTLIGACALLMSVLARAETVVDGRAIADEEQGANWLWVLHDWSAFSDQTRVCWR